MGYNAVLKVENTPGGRLMKAIKERVRKDPDLANLNLLIQEKGGQKVASVANFADPHTRDFCDRPNCFVCRTATKPSKGRCWQQGCCYKITCLECIKEGRKFVYFGESGHSSFYRGNFHVNGLRRKDPGNVLFCHQEQHHPGKVMEMKDFQMEIEGTFPRNISRQSMEGVIISKTVKLRDAGLPIYLMNSKREFYQPGVVRSTISPVLEGEQRRSSSYN